MKKDVFVDITKCPICSSSKYSLFYKESYNSPYLKDYLTNYYGGRLDFKLIKRKSFVVNYCNNCDFYWHKSILKDRYLKKLYTLWINSKESFLKHQMNKYPLQRAQIISFLIRCLNSQKLSLQRRDIKFLDYGGGWADFAVCAKALGCNAYIYDLSPARIKYAKTNGIDCLNSRDLNFHKGTFDFILLNQVLEHVPNPMKMIKTVNLLLKPGGILAISVPNAKSISHSKIVCKGPLQPLEHINGFTPKSLVKLLERSGFLIILGNPFFLEISFKKIILNLGLKIYSLVFKAPLFLFDTIVLCKKR